MIANLTEGGKLKDTPVTAEEVASAIAKQVLSGFGAQIIVPSSLGWTSLMRGMPGWLQESLRDTVTLILINATGHAPTWRGISNSIISNEICQLKLPF